MPSEYTNGSVIDPCGTLTGCLRGKDETAKILARGRKHIPVAESPRQDACDGIIHASIVYAGQEVFTMQYDHLLRFLLEDRADGRLSCFHTIISAQHGAYPKTAEELRTFLSNLCISVESAGVRVDFQPVEQNPTDFPGGVSCLAGESEVDVSSEPRAFAGANRQRTDLLADIQAAFEGW